MTIKRNTILRSTFAIHFHNIWSISNILRIQNTINNNKIKNISVHQIVLPITTGTLSFSQCLCGWNLMSVFLLLLYFICLWSLYLEVTSAEKFLCLSCKTILKVSYLIIILWISPRKGECVELNHSLGCVYPTSYIIRVLGQVYHFSLLVFYLCSFVSNKNKFLSFCDGCRNNVVLLGEFNSNA